MEVKGKVKFIGVDNQVSASFVKRELVVTTDEQYPQHILINFTQDKVDLLDPLKIGQEVSVSINLRGREWLDPKTNTNRYFNDIQGWRVTQMQPAHHAQGTQQAPAPAAPTFAPAANFNEDEPDDLPF